MLTAKVFTVKEVFGQGSLRSKMFTVNEDLEEGLRPREMLMDVNSYCSWEMVVFKGVC